MTDEDYDGDQPRKEEEDEDKVGYKRPPKAHRFRKGRSGNPRGRRKGSKSFETLVREELTAKVRFKSNGKVKSVSVARALLKRTLHEGISGSRRAADQGIRLMERYGLFDDSEVAGYDLKRLTREELHEFDRLFHKALGLEEERKAERERQAAEREAERERIFGPRRDETDGSDSDASLPS